MIYYKKIIILILSLGLCVAFSESSTAISSLGEVDSQSPIVSVSSPATGDTLESNTTVQLEYSITEDTNYDNISGAVFISEVQNPDYDFTLNSGETAWTSPMDNPQSVYIQLSVSDSYGNTGTGNSGVFSVGETSSTATSSLGEVDSQSPIVSVSSPADTTTIPEFDSLDVAWIISNVSSTDSVELYFTNGGAFLFQGNVQYEDDFSFIVPSGVTDSAQIKLIAQDIYGNMGEDLSEYFSVTDNTPPTVSINIIETAHIGNETEISWIGTDNTGFRSHHLYFSENTESAFAFVDSVAGLDSVFTWIVPNVATETARIRIKSIDLVGLMANDTTGFFIIQDGISPQITVLSPTTESSIPEFDTLTVSWEATDNIEMDSVAVYFSNDGNFILHGKVQYEEDFSFEIPQGMTENALIKVIAYDIYGNMGENVSESFFVTDGTAPTVDFTLPVISDTFIIGASMQILWNASDNVGVETISLFYKTTGDWISISENTVNEGEYEWLVPNEPTENLSLRLIGFDAVGLSDTSMVENISIEIAYPVMVNPAFWSNIHFKSKEFIFNFSQALDSNTVSDATVQFQSAHSDLSPSISYIDSSFTIKVTFENGLVSLDTLSISFSSDISNIYGYTLDGNQDGVGGDGISIEFYTSMLGDYDGDFTISVEDVAQFIINWESDNYAEELGPFTGEIPHVSVNPDQDFNIDDMTAFAMMWNWYYANNTLAFAHYEDEGSPVSIETEHDSIYLNIPQDISAYQVQIQYTLGSFFIGDSKGDEELFFTHEEKELGVYTIMAKPGQHKLAIPIEIRGKNAGISISYKGVGTESELVGQMTRKITIENVPDEFMLYANYPNPFNPVTRIDYGLPEDNHVTMVIYDIMGREIKTLVNGIQKAGYKSIVWDGTNAFGNSVSAGMYFYMIQADDFRQVRKMILLK